MYTVVRCVQESAELRLIRKVSREVKQLHFILQCLELKGMSQIRSSTCLQNSSGNRPRKGKCLAHSYVMAELRQRASFLTDYSRGTRYIFLDNCFLQEFCVSEGHLGMSGITCFLLQLYLWAADTYIRANCFFDFIILSILMNTIFQAVC